MHVLSPTFLFADYHPFYIFFVYFIAGIHFFAFYS